MVLTQSERIKIQSLPPRGGWIEMYCRIAGFDADLRPSPHGEGGLKFYFISIEINDILSLPPRGGWIEI